MLIGLQNFHRFRVMAKDGFAGYVTGFEFDDREWKVRFMVVDAKASLGRTILVDPTLMASSDFLDQTITLRSNLNHLALNSVIEDPTLGSQSTKIAKYDTFRWPFFWTGAGIWGSAIQMIPPTRRKRPIETRSHKGNPLTDLEEISGLNIKTSEGDTFGTLDDLVVDDQSWKVRYLVIDLRRWFPGKNVIVPPERVKSIDWMRQHLLLDFDHESLRAAPRVTEYEPISPETDAIARSYFLRTPSQQIAS